MPGNLFAALGTAANALDVMQQAMGVIQNNVTNASTPGYVNQTLILNASAFDPAHGLIGGVQAGNFQSARDVFAEQSVWAANQQVGFATRQATSLQALQSGFDISGQSGIPSALSNLYSAFSGWSNSPTSGTAQQQVIAAAQGVAQAFNSAYTQAETVRDQAIQQTQSSVTQINQLTSQIAAINGQIRTGSRNDAGLEAQLYNDLEQLSNLVNFSARTESDGSVTVLMNGQVPLVIGVTQTTLSTTNVNSAGAGSNAAPDQQILTNSGQDVTAQVEGGQLGGLLQITNTVLPTILGDANQQGSLNQLAQGISDRVNTLLTSGQTSSGTAGVPLFSYNAASPTSIAATLAVSSSVSGSQLAPVDPGPPSVANGIVDKLAQLQNPTNAADMLNGMSYTDFYSTIASNIGTLQSSAAQYEQTQTQVLTQAQSARSQLSGVSLNEQAAQLLQFQNAYQASAQALSSINSTIQFLMQAMQSL
jgi:flagellar hook-associated protein 1 FlgK